MSYIFDLAAGLKSRFHTDNPYELADDIGVHVMHRELGQLKGMYVYYERNRYIVINASLNARMRKLVCAHELGHDRLHQGIAKVAALRDIMIGDMSSKPEWEANMFAAELLIEDDDVERLALEGRSFYNIASILCVPKEILSFKATAMNVRGNKLNMPEGIRSDFLGR